MLSALTSDAAVEHYPGWGVYGASKAALEHLTLHLAAEDPSSPATPSTPATCAPQMHQDAFPGEDISDRPVPETVVPALLQLLDPAALRALPRRRLRAAGEVGAR